MINIKLYGTGVREVGTYGPFNVTKRNELSKLSKQQLKDYFKKHNIIKEQHYRIDTPRR